VPHPRARVLDAIRQALGDAEPLLDRRQQQYPGVRGQPAAVESDMTGLPATAGKLGRIPVLSFMASANSVSLG